MPIPLQQFCQRLAEIAPLRLAESWDNVGLLIGRREAGIERVMTCLTITPNVVAEAIGSRVDLIVAHHPFPFRPSNKFTDDTVPGRMLLDLAAAGIAVYSAHTAFDSAREGINQQWAESLSLQSIEPIVEVRAADVAMGDAVADQDLGSGRIGKLSSPTPARDVIARCGRSVSESVICRAVGPVDRRVTRVGFACGSGGSFVAAAHRRGCELLITGEATFHQCLEAEATGVVLGLLGHYHSERFAMEKLAERLAADFQELSIWPSKDEIDPLIAV